MITDLTKRAAPVRSTPSVGATLALGFRPFFLLAGLFAASVMPLWLLVFLGGYSLPTQLAASAWHGHEMIYGFVVAVIAGFLLTAVRNWTGQTMPSGAWLATLALVWASGRVGVVLSGTLPTPIGPIVDLLFVPVLAWTVARPLFRTKNWRNLGLVGPLIVLFGANVFFHFGPAGSASPAMRLAIDAVILLIVVVGGRVIPSFTENALRVTIVRRAWLDWLALVSVGVMAVLDVVPGAAGWAGGAAIVAGASNGARMTAWRSLTTRQQPILWVLHLGYAWLALGLLVSGVAAFTTWPTTAPLHALTVGAIGLLVLGMTSRVSLGHTGRLLSVGRPMVVAYVALATAAAVRSLGPLLVPGAYRWEILVSGVLWTLAFGLFVMTYLPILTTPRVDGKPG